LPADFLMREAEPRKDNPFAMTSGKRQPPGNSGSDEGLSSPGLEEQYPDDDEEREPETHTLDARQIQEILSEKVASQPAEFAEDTPNAGLSQAQELSELPEESPLPREKALQQAIATPPDEDDDDRSTVDASSLVERMVKRGLRDAEPEAPPPRVDSTLEMEPERAARLIAVAKQAEFEDTPKVPDEEMAVVSWKGPPQDPEKKPTRPELPRSIGSAAIDTGPEDLEDEDTEGRTTIEERNPMAGASPDAHETPMDGLPRVAEGPEEDDAEDEGGGTVVDHPAPQMDSGKETGPLVEGEETSEEAACQPPAQKPTRRERQHKIVPEPDSEPEPGPAPGPTMGAGGAAVPHTVILKDGVRRPVLSVEVGGQSFERELDDDDCVLGRAAECDVVLPDPGVSRRHARVELGDEGWVVQDLGSGNGTFLNTERVQRARLFDGDIITLGSSTVVFVAPDIGPRPAQDAPEATGEGRALRPVRSRRRFLYLACVIVALIGVLGIVKVQLRPRPPPAPSPQELARVEEARRIAERDAVLDRLKQLIREERWKDALEPVRALAEEWPQDPRVKEYAETVEREAAAAAALAEARAKLEQKDFAAALAELGKVPAESLQAHQVPDLKKMIEQASREQQFGELQKAMQEKRFGDAVALAESMLSRDAGDSAAREIKNRAERALREEERKAERERRKQEQRKKKKPLRPRPRPGGGLLLSGDALAAYREGNLERARAGADPAAQDGLARFGELYQKTAKVAGQGGQVEEMVLALVDAQELDRRLGGGQGKFSAEIKARLGKAFFLKGTDAYNGKNLPEAYRCFNKALSYKPDLDMARERLKALESDANRMFETAYVVKSSDAERAQGLCRTVLQIVPPTARAYEKCKKLLSDLQPADAPDSSGGF